MVNRIDWRPVFNLPVLISISLMRHRWALEAAFSSILQKALQSMRKSHTSLMSERQALSQGSRAVSVQIGLGLSERHAPEFGISTAPFLIRGSTGKPFSQWTLAEYSNTILRGAPRCGSIWATPSSFIGLHVLVPFTIFSPVWG